MTHRTMIAVVLAVAGAAHADALHFKEHGFSIKPLAGRSDGQTQQVLTMSLPAADGFAANVNVQMQPFAGSLDDYLKVSREQFKTAGVELIGEKRVGNSVVIFEYAGAFQGVKLHWYQRAELSKGKVCLATATALASSWSALAAELKATVDSLKLDK